jgi:ribosomal protein L37E
VDIQGSHHCIAGCADDPCPACQEAMQTSTKEVITMRCGHAMHNECFDAMVCAGNLSCPKCRKSVVRDPIAEAEMRRAIQSTPMPDEYASLRVEVLCNDCGAKCTCAFHVFGHICTHCGSINTAKLRQWQSAPHAALRSAEEAEQEEDALEASDLSGEEDDNTEDDDNFYAAAAGDDDAADGR